MRSLMTILNIKWQDRVSILQVLDKAESTSIEVIILKSRFRWVGHVIRMEDNKLPKRLMFGELTSWKRKQGMPLKRFKDCVKASISQTEITPKELEPRAHDRTGWRALTRHTMDTIEDRRRTQIEEARERRKASADAGLFPLSLDLQVWNRTPQPPPCPWQTGEMLKNVIIDIDGLLLGLLLAGVNTTIKKKMAFKLATKGITALSN